MKNIIALTIAALILCGCSTSGSVTTPDIENSTDSPLLRLPQKTRWNWQTSLYRVSEDHSTIERLPARTSDWHLNVTPFVEPPNCNHCLMIGKPQLQPDGTIKVKVMLTLPFPGQPKYTGFDVKGTLIFPATRHWKWKYGSLETAKQYFTIFDGNVPFYFSLAKDGGGELLNADGYTFYLFPGLDFGPEFSLPIYNYSKGKYANGPDPDSTINGFKLFTKDLDRRMFLVTDTITRTYHIAPPEGEFIFGYVVDASWAAPTVTPVTDPKNDFPYYANAEELYVLKSEQIAPFILGDYTDSGNEIAYDVTQITMMTHKEMKLISINSTLWCPDISSSPQCKIFGVAQTVHYTMEEDGIYSAKHRIRKGVYDAPPGEYTALICAWAAYNVYADGYHPTQLFKPIYFDFIELEMVEGEE